MNYKSFFDKLPCLVLIVDESTKIINVNDACVSILGWDKSELIGHRFMDFIHPADHVKTFNIIDKMYMYPITKFKNRCKCKKISAFTFCAMLPGGYVELEWESNIWENGTIIATARLHERPASIEDYSAVSLESSKKK